MKFLIQTINGKVKHDFSSTLIEACDYNNWYTNSCDYKTSFTELQELEYAPGFIPVGSVEFVTKYLSFYNKTPKPVNIPKELIYKHYLGRDISFGNKHDINKFPVFVKSDTSIKKFTEIISSASILDQVPDDKYLISEIIEIDSEWRAFVYKRKLVGLQNYSGDFTVFPDVNKINEMTKEYSSSPVAYTLDVLVNKDGTFLIEVHDFFSCGLYGFSDYKLLPIMFRDWFNEYTK